MSRISGRSARIATAFLATCLLSTAGCGTTVSGEPQRATPEKSTLDVGNYPFAPRTVGNAKSDMQARAREAQRLADYVALPFEADPAYVVDEGFFTSPIVLNGKGLRRMVINDTFDDVAKDLTAGWVHSWSTAPNPEGKNRTISLAVLLFPDAATARQVGPTLEHDDFTFNADNQPVQITKHPATAAHWRPGVSSIGSWTVHDRYVVFIKVDDESQPADLLALTSPVERMLDVQLPLLDKFVPTPAAELSTIALDVDGLLGRTLPSSPDKPVRAQPDGVFTGRGVLSLLSLAGSATLARMQDFEVDLISFGEALIFRSRTREAAERHWEERKSSAKQSELANMLYKPVDVPTGLGDRVSCHTFATKVNETETTTTNFCSFHTDQYLVELEGLQLQDLHQRVNAQYAMLTGK
ncbi:DUF7373 family lipoprotein [Nocardia salmonicida]|uniref:DUF7373 family lipoprotein n=1 Tax=Nocardia salmonicida TaxID=53431 RepID=UPI0033C4D216